MLYKKTVVIWGTDKDEVEEAAKDAVEIARMRGVVSFGNGVDAQPIGDPYSDPDFEESVEALLE